VSFKAEEPVHRRFAMSGSSCKDAMVGSTHAEKPEWHETPVLSFGRRNQVESKTEIRPVIPFTRIIFLVSAFLAAIAGIQLYILCGMVPAISALCGCE